MTTAVSDLWQVKAPYFCAGLISDQGRRTVVRAAPILRWAIGYHIVDVQDRVLARGWSIRFVGSA